VTSCVPRRSIQARDAILAPPIFQLIDP
jgi:hypothetical protein